MPLFNPPAILPLPGLSVGTGAPAAYAVDTVNATTSNRINSKSGESTAAGSVVAENDAGSIVQMFMAGSAFATAFLSLPAATNVGYFVSNTRPLGIGTLGAQSVYIGANNIGRLRVGAGAEAANATQLFCKVNNVEKQILADTAANILGAGGLILYTLP